MADETFDLMLKVTRLRPGAKLPTRGSAEAAGLDLYAAEGVTAAGDTAVVPTGIAVEIPRGWFGLILGRSGLAARGVDVLGGVIDPDFRGEVKVILREPTWGVSVGPGDRVGQLVILPVPAVEVVEVDSLSETARGTNGFGSSGR